MLPYSAILFYPGQQPQGHLSFLPSATYLKIEVKPEGAKGKGLHEENVKWNEIEKREMALMEL